MILANPGEHNYLVPMIWHYPIFMFPIIEPSLFCTDKTTQLSKPIVPEPINRTAKAFTPRYCEDKR